VVPSEAVPLFLVGTLILFIADRMGWLLRIQVAAEPLIVHMLDLPPKATEAFLIGFLRRDYGAAGLFSMAKAGMLSNLQVMVSLVTITLFIPCLANLLVIVKEHGGKVAAGMALFIFPFALLVGAAVNFFARWRGSLFEPTGTHREDPMPAVSARDRSVGQRLPVRLPHGKGMHPCLLPGMRVLFPMPESKVVNFLKSLLSKGNRK